MFMVYNKQIIRKRKSQVFSCTRNTVLESELPVREALPQHIQESPASKSASFGEQKSSFSMQTSHDLPRGPAYQHRGRFFIDKPLEICGFGGIFAWRGYVAAGCGGYGW